MYIVADVAAKDAHTPLPAHLVALFPYGGNPTRQGFGAPGIALAGLPGFACG